MHAVLLLVRYSLLRESHHNGSGQYRKRYFVNNGVHLEACSTSSLVFKYEPIDRIYDHIREKDHKLILNTLDQREKTMSPFVMQETPR
jgi:hypothetical protein